ncbi:MAG: hypothetical protein OXF68_12600 [Gammaproteobacteria bacterium]|nr:hypothetical protein [Gammaproteobacteria bacterium]
MLERHEVLRSGRKVDRNWWYSTKLGMVVLTALVAAYVVHATLV